MSKYGRRNGATEFMIRSVIDMLELGGKVQVICRDARHRTMLQGRLFDKLNGRYADCLCFTLVGDVKSKGLSREWRKVEDHFTRDK